MNVDEFWSILLQVEIPEGIFYPPAEDMTEISRDAFVIPKDILLPLFEEHSEKRIGFKSGASIVLRSFFPTMYNNKIKIPWCIHRTNISSSAGIYHKPDIAKIQWYCPWKECEVTKTWFIYKIPPDGKFNFFSRVS